MYAWLFIKDFYTVYINIQNRDKHMKHAEPLDVTLEHQRHLPHTKTNTHSAQLDSTTTEERNLDYITHKRGSVTSFFLSFQGNVTQLYIYMGNIYKSLFIL